MIFPASRISGTREDMPSLQRLQALLGKPEEAWGWPRREVWEASEQHLGVTLPADYKAFMDVYGPGTLGGYLHLNRPTGLMTPAELEDFWSLEAWRDARKGWEDLYPFPFHPDPGGLISWGHDEHSSEYYFLANDPDPDNWEIVVGSRGGFETQDKAKTEAKKELKKAERGTDVLSSATVGDDLNAWLERKGSLARTTSHGYEGHVRIYLMPHLGHIKRKDLHARHIEAMYAAIKKENAERLLHHGRVVELTQARDAAKEAWIRASGKPEERRQTRSAYLAANAALRKGARGLRKITGPATLHRINATLSSFLNSGIKRLEYQTNWASLIELPSVKRPKPLVWTPERVEHWQRTGERPGPVMVWTPEQAGGFLDFVADDRLYALWDTFTFLGPRRGEMAALPWTEVSLTALRMRISAQLVEVAYRVYGEEPKADSVRTMSISSHSGRVLTTHQVNQERARSEWEGEEAWVESGCVFTMENGAALHPDWISRRFKRLVELSGLPPVRLHDLRHLSASLALLANNDIKVVQERLGHSSRQITSDTYTSVLPELFRSEAESTVAVVPRGGEVTYTVKKALRVPDSAFVQDVAVCSPAPPVPGGSRGGSLGFRRLPAVGSWAGSRPRLTRLSGRQMRPKRGFGRTARSRATRSSEARTLRTESPTTRRTRWRSCVL
ncbi:tyrosine-type recombinase/integrase [Streptomyces sp. NPDC091027]|uniref:tyrosine-type recombinase/integrase n=1 Tax=Streptomyces sp. NPDC091027 TaxID=3365971 RepID=UPI00382426E4